MNCENCNKEHDGTYGSGRFCSSKCARGFSTKEKRKEINKKLRKEKNVLFKICLGCKTYFETYHEHKKYCSRQCANIFAQLGKEKKKGDKRKKGSGGLRPGGGRSKQISYVNWLGFKMSINKEEIKMAKIMDEKKLNWRRNTKGFSYLTLDGKQRNYYPDFVVNETQYYEYKGWITEEMIHKMNDAKIKNNLNLTIIIGNDKRYRNFGLTLDEFYLSLL